MRHPRLRAGSATPPVEPARASISSWLTTELAVPSRHSRARMIGVVAATIAIIGWGDHQSGFLVSFELFYLVPITLAVAWLGPRAGAIAAVMSMVVRGAGDLVVTPGIVPLSTFWNWLTDVLVYLVVVWVMHRLLSLYRELDRRVEHRTRELQESIRVRRQLEREVLGIAAHERNAIGRELHDDLCQHLVGTAFATRVLAEHLALRDTGAATRAHAIVEYVEDGIAKARGLARGLLLDSLPPAELPDALAELAARSSEGGVPCRFLLEGEPAIADAATGAQILRIAQESLRNALRHAKPTRVDVVLGGSREAAFLIVKDDGCGLPEPGARGTGMGLKIMEHRATLIGGILSVRSAAGRGTSVVCHLPREPSPPS